MKNKEIVVKVHEIATKKKFFPEKLFFFVKFTSFYSNVETFNLINQNFKSKGFNIGIKTRKFSKKK